jgi:antirestriction protein ArdC
MSVGTIYEMVTEKVLAAIESTGELPWRKPWTTYADGSIFPRNLVTGRFYSGINVVLLGTQYYESPFWLTIKQCGDIGGRVRKGEKGSMIIYWKLLERKVEKEGKEKTERVPLIRYSTVFNSSQCEGITVPELSKIQRTDAEKLEACESMLDRYSEGPRMEYNRQRAAYDPVTDTVMIPGLASFLSSEGYYSTMFHELVHSTGHVGRLNRFTSPENFRFGSEEYGKEELIAEIGASFLCAETGIVPRTIENSLGYVKRWAEVIKANPKLVVEAASQAQKAVDLIAGRTREEAKAAA